MNRRVFLCLLSLAAAVPALPAQAPASSGGEALPDLAPDRFRLSTDPWGGFNKDRAMWGQVEKFALVDDGGSIVPAPFPPAIDAADFQKKGLADILMVDGDGYVRYFPNTGTKAAPRFATGIVLPVQLPMAPFQLQAVDCDGDGRPDLLLGGADGSLYLLRNLGDAGCPGFEGKKPAQASVDVTQGGHPWCNFLSPAYAQWRPGTAAMDLILGDGTYASDNIYYLRNKGSNERPDFDRRVLLIAGNGRQHLTARACFWTRPDRPDLLVGERNGSVSLYVNDTGEGDSVPRFRPAKPLSVGGNPRFAPLGRLSVADLNGDGKPDLIWGDLQGAVWYALNAGTADEPAFASAVPLTCPDPPQPRAIPVHWTLRNDFRGTSALPQAGGFFYFLHTVGSDPLEPATYDPQLAMPDGFPGKYALKFEFVDPPPQVASSYPPYVDEDGEEGRYGIHYTLNGYNANSFPLKEKVTYRIRFQVKGEGFSSVRLALNGSEKAVVTAGGREVYEVRPLGFKDDIPLGSSWQPYEHVFTFQYDKAVDESQKGQPAPFYFGFSLAGKGTLYITDISIKPAAK